MEAIKVLLFCLVCLLHLIVVISVFYIMMYVGWF